MNTKHPESRASEAVGATRRELLGALAVAPLAACAAGAPRTALGIVIHSFGMRTAHDRKNGVTPPFHDPLRFLDYCDQLGANGVQVPLGVRDAPYIAALRRAAESRGLYVEGIVRLPAERSDVERFDAELRTAREAGAGVVRTALLDGRRYETFDDPDAFRHFADRAWNSLIFAEPVAARHRVRLAVENHKDWRIPELLGMMTRLGSPHVGICVDLGNSIALLEDPAEVVEAYAPHAFATHVKDMAVAEYEDGFLLAEVPLGTGFLDIPAMITRLRRAQPEIHLSLEMITRDPLRVPCLTEKYWATLGAVSGKQLARTLTLIRTHGSKQQLPTVNELSEQARIDREDENVRQCLDYARDRLRI